jgi:hypothetical protein
MRHENLRQHVGVVVEELGVVLEILRDGVRVHGGCLVLRSGEMEGRGRHILTAQPAGARATVG